MIPNRYFTSSISSLDLGRMIRPFVRNCTPECFPWTAAWVDPRPLHRRSGRLLLALTVLATDGPPPAQIGHWPSRCPLLGI